MPKRFVLDGFPRQERLIMEGMLGDSCVIEKTVSEGVDAVFTNTYIGDTPGQRSRAVNAALKLGIPVKTDEEFYQMIETGEIPD